MVSLWRSVFERQLVLALDCKVLVTIKYSPVAKAASRSAGTRAPADPRTNVLMRHKRTRARSPLMPRSQNGISTSRESFRALLPGMLASILLVQSCENSMRATGNARTVVRDSAGIEIVVFPDNVFSLAPAFSIEDSILLDLGGEKNSPVEELGVVPRLQHLSGGRFLVRDQDSLGVPPFLRCRSRNSSVPGGNNSESEIAAISSASRHAASSVFNSPSIAPRSASS